MIRIKWEITTREVFMGVFPEGDVPEEIRAIIADPGTELFPFDDVDAEFLANQEDAGLTIEYSVNERTILTATEES